MGKKYKVLHVDDEPHIGHLIKLSLDKSVFEVINAYSTREAMKILQEQNIHIIISDIQRRTDDEGFKFCEKIRKNKKYRKIPLVFLSNNGEINNRLYAIDIGADDYLTKPFDPMELERRIKLNLRV